MRKDAPLAYDVPSSDRDNPGWVKVGVIAVLGFVIGIAWPRLMGVRLGPSAPGEAASALAASSASAMPKSEAVPAVPAQPAAVLTVAAGAAPSATAPRVDDTPADTGVNVALGKTSMLSCKADGETKKGKDCGTLAGLDTLVNGRLRKLSTCAAAEGQSGKLSVVVTADFAANKVSWDLGKSSTVGNADGIGGCLKTLFTGATTAGITHEHPRYVVAYSAMISGPRGAKNASVEENGAPPPKENREPVTASAGESTIGWDVALVRETPKVGAIVARLPRGSKVKVGANKDGWLSIKYGDGFASEGWIYRGALGH